MIGKRQLRKVISIGILFLMMTISLGVTGITVHADESNVHLDIDDINLEIGVSTNLTLTIEDMDGAKFKSIEGLENFEVLSSSQSTSTQIINNNSSNQIQLNYVLMPNAVGDYKLTGYVEYQGKTYTTNVLDVHVSEKSQSSGDDSSDLFVTTTLSKESAYFGQKLILTYELYSRYNIVDYGFIDEIKLDGFISKDIPTEQLQANYETINGNKYVKYEVKKTILTPITTGSLKIPASNFQVNVSTGDFFNSSKAVYISTEEKEVQVKELPMDQQPSDFTGLIGQLEVKAEYSADEVDYGQSLTVHVTLSGDCNLEILDTLHAKTPTGFTQYETEKDLKEDLTGNQYSAQKEFDVILVPQATGEINIEPISINYFDDVDNQYKEVVIPGKTIQVNGEIPATSVINPNANGKTQLEPILITQINPSNTDDTYFIIKKNHVYRVITALVLLVMLLTIALIINKRRLKQDRNLQQMVMRSRKSKDHNESYNILNEIIKYRYHISLKASSRYEIQKQIGNEVLVKQLFSLMDYVELRNRNEGVSSFNFKEHLNKIVKEIKNEWRF